jgi:hypothetical protein
MSPRAAKFKYLLLFSCINIKINFFKKIILIYDKKNKKIFYLRDKNEKVK